MEPMVAIGRRILDSAVSVINVIVSPGKRQQRKLEEQKAEIRSIMVHIVTDGSRS